MALYCMFPAYVFVYVFRPYWGRIQKSGIG